LPNSYKTAAVMLLNRYKEKKTMKRVTVIVLALVVVLAMVPAVALAETTVNTAGELNIALAAGGDIVLGADIDAGDLVQGAFFTVPGGKTVTLDLNGHTLQGTRINGTISSGNRNTAIITNNGTLTIMDTAGGGALMIDATTDDSWNSCTAAVSNLATLTIESGMLLNNGGTSMAYAVDSLSGSPVVTVNGGTLKSVNYIAIRQFANSTANPNIVNINGGTIFGNRRGIWIQQPSASNGIAVLNISGGTVEANLQAAVQVDLLGTDGVDITITGGDLINHSDIRATLALILDSVPTAGGAHITINGGKFSNTGTAGNIGDYTTGGTATPSVIEVFAGTFSALVPSQYIAVGANPDDIVMGDDTDVTADVNPSYIIVIPALVDFGNLQKNTGAKEIDFDISASNVLLEQGAKINVNVSSTFSMNDGAGNLLVYNLFNEAGTEFSSNGLFTSFTADGKDEGKVKVDTAQISKAGAYSGTMLFTCIYAS
jgi:hypothetical protein